jgi:hypothetical protein
VHLQTDGPATVLLLVFDAYYVDKQPVFHLPLDKRLEYVAAFVDKRFASGIENGANAYTIRAKKLLIADTGKGDIFELCKTLLKSNGAGTFEYNTDGFIFTPVRLPVGGTIGAPDVPALGGTWDHVLKWKPPRDNTIDFWVTVQKHDNGQDIIGIDDATGNRFKTLNLFVGSQLTTAQDYFERAADGGSDYRLKPFLPSDAGDYVTHTTRVVCGPDGAISCANGDEIINNYVVEMSFSLDAKCWIPYRVRYDKTEQAAAEQGTVTANSFANASTVWRTIVNPVTEGHIKGEIRIVSADDMLMGSRVEDLYYNRNTDRNKSMSKPMLTFHNIWVKDHCLIKRFKGKCTSLIDLACGKGGDLSKWCYNGFNVVVGVDIFEDNIMNSSDGAYKRLSEEKNVVIPFYKYAFVPMDSSQPIDGAQIETIANPYAKGVAKCIWGLGDKAEADVQSYSHLWGIGKAGFDVVSCQFALHYFFEDTKKLGAFLDNVDAHIKPGGYFIGTCFDGDGVAALLKDVDEGATVTGTKMGQDIWSITKMYKEYDEKRIGQKIKVFVETINRSHEEYLVPMSRLTKEMRRRGMRLLTPGECKYLGLGMDESSCLFDKLFARMMDEMNRQITNSNVRSNTNIKLAAKMAECKDECTFSFLNRMFIFKKDGEVSVDEQGESDDDDDDDVPVPAPKAPKAKASTRKKVHSPSESGSEELAPVSVPKAKAKATRKKVPSPSESGSEDEVPASVPKAKASTRKKVPSPSESGSEELAPVSVPKAKAKASTRKKVPSPSESGSEELAPVSVPKAKAKATRKKVPSPSESGSDDEVPASVPKAKASTRKKVPSPSESGSEELAPVSVPKAKAKATRKKPALDVVDSGDDAPVPPPKPRARKSTAVATKPKI